MPRLARTEVPSHFVAHVETLKPRPVQSTNVFRVGGSGKIAQLPSFLPTKGWSIHNKGYLIYTSRSKTSGIRRGARAHRLVMARMLGRDLREDEIVHHMDFSKTNCEPYNLLLTTVCFNPTGALRDPYTGEFMSKDAYLRRYGI